MNYERLEKNIIDNIKEAQIKLGFDNRPMSFNYAENSLKSLLYTENDLQSVLDDFSVSVSERLGNLSFRKIKNGFCITVPVEGTAYVNNLNGFDFITEFVNTIRLHEISIDNIISIFKKYSDNVIVQKKNNGEFDYLIYFSDGNPDEYYYCISLEEEIDGHLHITYHRFIKEDYMEFSFWIIICFL